MVAVGKGEAACFGKQVHGLDRVGAQRSHVEALDHAKQGEHCNAARAWWRHAANAFAAIGATDRRAFPCGIASEVGFGEVAGALMCTHGGHDVARNIAAIERIRSFACNGAKGGGVGRVAQHCTDRACRPSRGGVRAGINLVKIIRSGRIAAQQRVTRQQGVQARREREAR